MRYDCGALEARNVLYKNTAQYTVFRFPFATKYSRLTRRPVKFPALTLSTTQP
jgi:hypothetical protein